MPGYRLAARSEDHIDTVVKIPMATGTLSIGEGCCTIIAGPCAIESRDAYLEIALMLKDMGVHILRGGLINPVRPLILLPDWAQRASVYWPKPVK